MTCCTSLRSSNHLLPLKCQYKPPLQALQASPAINPLFELPLKMTTKMMLLLLLLIGLSVNTQAACSSAGDLVACLPAAEADVQPTTGCCTALNSYLATDTSGTCLCEIASTAAFNTSGAVVEYAVTIPEKCSATYSAGTVCDGVTIPGGQ